MSESDDKPEPGRSSHHLGLLLLSFAASGSCLLLGWWQWNRFHANGGSFQNLGYALQWPLFSVFVVYGYFRFFRLNKDSRAGHDVTTAPRFSSAMPALPEPARHEDLVQSRHRGLAAYNAMFAELAEQDVQDEPAERNAR